VSAAGPPGGRCAGCAEPSDGPQINEGAGAITMSFEETMEHVVQGFEAAGVAVLIIG
jgi:hypothetical protein